MVAALREMDAEEAAIGGNTVHYAPGDSPLCGEEVMGAPMSLKRWQGRHCLELVAEDLADDNAYMGRCRHCQREIHAQGGVEWCRTVRSPCPHCGRAGW